MATEQTGKGGKKQDVSVPVESEGVGPIGERAADDPHYNLISILYHALKGADLYDEYIGDAEAAGDSELRDFFIEAQQESTRLAERARELLRARLDRDAEPWDEGVDSTKNAAE